MSSPPQHSPEEELSGPIEALAGPSAVRTPLSTSPTALRKQAHSALHPPTLTHTPSTAEEIDDEIPPPIEPIASTSQLKSVGLHGATVKDRPRQDDHKQGEDKDDEPAELEDEEEGVICEDEPSSGEDEASAGENEARASSDEQPPEPEPTPQETPPVEQPTAQASSKAAGEDTAEADDDYGTSSVGSSEYDSSDESDSDEPTLKYARLAGETDQILGRDSASAMATSKKFIAVGTHNGLVFILDFAGKILNRFRPHSATINQLTIDDHSEFVASASIDGLVAIQSLLSPECSVYNAKRPMRCVALEPGYAKRSTRQFVSGGMAGNLVLHEKGWLGNKESTIHAGEGPIWAVEWRGSLIAWANDAGVRIYDTVTAQRITFIPRADHSPRADLFKCTLHWQDDTTLLIAWADLIKVAVVQQRAKSAPLGLGPGSSEQFVEVRAVFQVDCMISGIAPNPGSGYLILAYLTEDHGEDEGDETKQKRQLATRPELRVISAEGEELSSDAIGLRNFAQAQCRDYSLCQAPEGGKYFVLAPQDIVVAQNRDEADHVSWLIEQSRYEAALHALETAGVQTKGAFDVGEVGRKYLEWLADEGEFDKAASLCPKILSFNAKHWEHWVFLFADKGRLETIIPVVPTHDPQLSRLVYEMILSHLLRHDHDALLRTVESWPHDIYDISAVIVAIQDQIERHPDSAALMEAVSSLFIRNRQPGKALPYYLKLRKPNVFALIRDNNLFTDVQDQALRLIEFDQKNDTQPTPTESESKHGTAISLLVDHTHSIPISRVVGQLKGHRQFLFMYLDALFDKDAHLAFDYSDLQVDLYAEFEPNKLMDFLRASNFYSLERAFAICDQRELVPEMVFLLGRMGDNKRALNLIIERLGDVQRAIDFAKEQNDHDLWEDLLKYSETKPQFIRGLLENVGPEIDPIRLIRRIKNGLEIPGLKPALIKILQDFNLQISLMEGCKTILYSDCRELALALHAGQSNGFLWTADTKCKIANEPIFPQLNGPAPVTTVPYGVHYLCSHTYEGPRAFPDAPAYLAGETRSAAILAEELLAEQLPAEINNPGQFSERTARKDPQSVRLAAKVRRAQELKDSAGRRGATCEECDRAVAASEGSPTAARKGRR